MTIRQFAVLCSCAGLLIVFLSDWRIFVGIAVWAIGQEAASLARKKEQEATKQDAP
jgi:type IV secretory pathway TrbD component